MGREAVCTCDWAGNVAEIKALLESDEIILRGDIRKRIPFSELKQVRVQKEQLEFVVGKERVQLTLGTAIAEKWALVLTRPPASLAHKLGIKNDSVVFTLGEIGDENLKSALAEAVRLSAEEASLIVACVDTLESLQEALRQTKTMVGKGAPIWIVYRKGPGHPLNESAIRSLLRGNGLIDTKVASVSQALTALRFQRVNVNEAAGRKVRA